MKAWIIASLVATTLSPIWAFGQTIAECNDRQIITEMAMKVRDSINNGQSEDNLLIWAGGIEGPGLQAAAYKAIEAYTFSYPPGSISQVITVMQYMCKKTYRP